MTANQINYAKEIETERSNRVNEAENIRHNQQVEYETNRHNLAMEWNQAYANQIQAQYNAEVARSNLAREAETNRHNTQQEALQNFSNYTDRYKFYNSERETKLKERQFEFQKGIEVANVITRGISALGTLFNAGANLGKLLI